MFPDPLVCGYGLATLMYIVRLCILREMYCNEPLGQIYRDKEGYPKITILN